MRENKIYNDWYSFLLKINTFLYRQLRKAKRLAASLYDIPP
jgi:hypothetical protein